ncbi:hypothetical protein VaNZ11_014239 [Volvox africanus]|uniref:Uncharacterized protein n=1 Tax=Volvox africanus TaxID=51714 RepID=A0ABQ5SIW3_9CHLO|nr:hypothetical protein VaNZ11_014239 [Volvox africanus]
MSGLFNPFAEQEDQDRGASLYSDPLAAYASAPRPPPGSSAAGPSQGPPSGSGRGSTSPGGRFSGRGASAPHSQTPLHQTPVYGRGGGGRRWAQQYDPSAHRYGYSGWEQQVPGPLQRPVPPAYGGGYAGPGSRGGYGASPAVPRGGWRGSCSGGMRPNKWVRTEPLDAAGSPAPVPQQAAVATTPRPGLGQPQAVVGGPGGRGGLGRSGFRGGRGGRGGDGGWEKGGEVTPAGIAAYYKPTFSADPWAKLIPRPLQPSGINAVNIGGRSAPGQHSIDTRKLGGTSLAEIMAIDLPGDEAELHVAAVAAEGADPSIAISSEEPPEGGEAEQGMEPSPEEGAEGGRLGEDGAQDRPWH